MRIWLWESDVRKRMGLGAHPLTMMLFIFYLGFFKFVLIDQPFYRFVEMRNAKLYCDVSCRQSRNYVEH